MFQCRSAKEYVMSLFNLRTVEPAPEGFSEDITAVQKRIGFLPNIYGVLAESPAVIKAYNTLGNLLTTTSFSPAEQQLMLLTISAVNGCEYCVAAHTIGGMKAKLGDDVINAVRDGSAIADTKLAALSGFTRGVVEKRGNMSEPEIEAFLAAGYSKEQTLKVVMATALKTISNYINHFADTPLDAAFANAAWHAPESKVA
jgi:uncharacterized peroxidase-related enzyme